MFDLFNLFAGRSLLHPEGGLLLSFYHIIINFEDRRVTHDGVVFWAGVFFVDGLDVLVIGEDDELSFLGGPMLIFKASEYNKARMGEGDVFFMVQFLLDVAQNDYYSLPEALFIPAVKSCLVLR